MELKQVAKKIGFSRIKPDGKQHVIPKPNGRARLESLKENLPNHLQTRFVYTPGKVTVRGLGMLSADQQLSNLIDWLSRMQGALLEPALV